MDSKLSDAEVKLMREGELISATMDTPGWREVVAPYLQNQRIVLSEKVLSGDLSPKAGRAIATFLDTFQNYLVLRVKGARELGNQLSQEQASSIPTPEDLARRGRMEELRAVLTQKTVLRPAGELS